MSPQLQGRFADIEARRESMTQAILAMDEATRGTPVGKSFSPQELMEHMAVVSEMYLGLIAKAPAPGGGTAKPNFLFRLVLRTMTKPVGKVTPVPPQVRPKGKVDVKVAAARWKKANLQINDHFEKYGDDEFAIKNPLFGKMSAKDVHELLELHQTFHELRLRP